MVRLVIEKITSNGYSILVWNFCPLPSDATSIRCIYPFMKSLKEVLQKLILQHLLSYILLEFSQE